jgi:hypothetical protein
MNHREIIIHIIIFVPDVVPDVHHQCRSGIPASVEHSEELP